MSDEKPKVTRQIERQVEKDNKQAVEKGRSSTASDSFPKIQKTTGWNDTPPPPRKTKPK